MGKQPHQMNTKVNYLARLSYLLRSICKISNQINQDHRAFAPTIDFVDPTAAVTQLKEERSDDFESGSTFQPPKQKQPVDKDPKFMLKEKIDKLHTEIGKSIQQKKHASGGDTTFFKSMFGVFYKNYSLLVNSDSDAKLLPKLFTSSKILSELNKSILYFNMPYETILKERHIPQ